MMINWNKYCDHIYFIHLKNSNNNDFIDNLQKLEIYKKRILSIEYYETNKNFNEYKYFKDIKVLDCIVDAFFNDYDRIIIFRDDLLFEDIDTIKEILGDCIFNQISILNPNDICEDALLIGKKVIQYIYHHFFNYSIYKEKDWNINFKNLLKEKFNIHIPKKSICQHKIDYIIPYVNNNDINWLEKFNKYYSQITPESYNKLNRWNNLDNFIYNIRSIAKNMPWINNLFVLVDSESQIPEWINTNNIKIVYHKDFIPKEFLPIFNSCTIESFIYNIKELSEYFIFSNDDIFIINSLSKKDFFEEGHTKNNLINTLLDKKNHYKISNNSFYLINKEFNKEFKVYKRCIHVPHAMIKSSCVHIGEIHKDEINYSITRFRNDKNLNQYMYVIYEMMIGNNVSNNINNILIDINENRDFDLDEYEIICIKDTNIYNKTNLININKEFNKLFPEQSKYDNFSEDINKLYLINNKKNKVAVCAIAKNENIYIREWVEWYKNIGISKIFLYDNNELNGERFEDVINDYIQNGFVEIIDVRGVEKGCVFDENGMNLQTKCYVECYINKSSNYDWICFFDVDEFLTFRNDYTLEKFLRDKRFVNFDTILVGWQHYDDNNLLTYDNRPVMERFTHKSKYGFHGIKSIVRCGKQPINIYENNVIHIFRVTGNKVIRADFIEYNSSNNWFKYQSVDDHNCVLNHYKTKTAEEYIRRHLNRHWGTGKKKTERAKTIDHCIYDFFKYNVKTPEKLSIFYQQKAIINNDNNIIDNNKLIITLTSWKGRINNVHSTLLSLLENNIQPYKIILNLSEEEFTNKENDLPDTLLDLTKKYSNFEIYWVKKNNLVFKKLLPTLNRYKDYYIITVDDDVIYPDNLVKRILNEYSKYNNNMPMSFGGPQSDWHFKYHNIYSHYGAGSIVKYSFFGEYINELYDNVVLPALDNGIKMFDDVLYTYAALLNKYKYIRNLKYSVREYVMNSPKNDIGFSNGNDKQHEEDTEKCHKLFQEYIYNTYKKSIDNLINESSSNGGIVVNLTTWTKRDWCVYTMLNEFKKQTIKPNEIILWLSKDEYKEVPNNLKFCLKNNLLTSIRFVDGNIYGHKRYETFKTNNNCINILIDDDLYYWNTYVEELVNACKKYPYHAITYCSDEIEYEGVSRKHIQIKENNISQKNIYMSGLSAFPPQTFPVEMFNFTETRDKYSLKCDDSWVRAWLLKLNIPMLVLHNRKNYEFKEIENTQSVGIWETFNDKKDNNGILQVIKNFANSIFSLNGEDLVNRIWPKFEIRKCITYIEKANLRSMKNSLGFIPYIYNGNIINTNRLKEAIIIAGIKHGNFDNINIDDPKLIYEKINWLKIYDNLTLKAKCADKIKIHEYCKEKLGKDICIPIIKVYDSPDDINLNELPEKFVIKCNHGYKMNIICKNKNDLNLEETKEKCKEWLNTDFGIKTMQYQYSLIDKKCFVEEYKTNGKVGLTDYKFWCQNGNPCFVMVINDRYNGQDKIHANIYDLNWKYIELDWQTFPSNKQLLDNKPNTFNKMIEYAKILSKDFKFVRVDFYEINGQCYLGELTFTPDNGFFHFNKEKEIELGNTLLL